MTSKSKQLPAGWRAWPGPSQDHPNMTFMQEYKKEIAAAKKTWPKGPWKCEPDIVCWVYKGLPCQVLRNDTTGTLCGYVGVLPGHRFYKLKAEEDAFQVHGGITFSGHRAGLWSRPKHGPRALLASIELIEDKIMWFGFDTAHSFDLSPGLLRFGPRRARAFYRNGKYRTIAYVRKETNRLADQIHKRKE